MNNIKLTLKRHEEFTFFKLKENQCESFNVRVQNGLLFAIISKDIQMYHFYIKTQISFYNVFKYRNVR